MNPSDQKWQRLAAAARRAPDSREVTAPFGFSTRVAAQAFAAPSVSLLERFSLRLEVKHFAISSRATSVIGCSIFDLREID